MSNEPKKVGYTWSHRLLKLGAVAMPHTGIIWLVRTKARCAMREVDFYTHRKAVNVCRASGLPMPGRLQAHEVERIRELRSQGMKLKRIAITTGRSRHAVKRALGKG